MRFYDTPPSQCGIIDIIGQILVVFQVLGGENSSASTFIDEITESSLEDRPPMYCTWLFFTSPFTFNRVRNLFFSLLVPTHSMTCGAVLLSIFIILPSLRFGITRAGDFES